MRILVIEDDEKVASFVSKGLSQAGFTVDIAADGAKGLKQALSEPYAAAVVDLMIPKLDGLSLIGMLRKSKVQTPVIILSAKRSLEDKVKGLEAGADDYLLKPFAFSELLARVQALLRRAGGQASEATRLEAGPLSIDLISREVARGDQKIDLQAREFKLLEYLVRNQGRTVSKVMILENVWSYDFDPQTNVVDVLVCRLRDKVDKPFKDPLIHTIRGVGYVLKPA